MMGVIEAKSIPEPNSGCWLWIGWLSGKMGYGGIHHHGKHLVAHRVSFEVYNGPIPDGLQVCHKCDTPSCVNPDHLFLGTNHENALDRDRKGRGVPPPYNGPGEANTQAKLTWRKVAAIRADRRSKQAIANDYGVSRQAISDIHHNKKWRTREATNGQE